MKDQVLMGESHLVPFQYGEGFKRRHTRRLKVAIDTLPVLRRFCKSNQIEVKIQGNGYRWTFHKSTDFLLPGVLRESTVDWWPSTAKLIINQEWTRGHHCHDFWMCIEVLKQVFK